MLGYFILLLPFSICYGFTMQLLMRRNKDALQKTAICLIAALGIYFLCYSYECNPASSERALFAVDIIKQWLTAILIPLGVAIMNGLKQKTMFNKEVLLLVIPGFLLGTTSTIIHLFGLGEEMHQLVCVTICHIILFVEMIYFIGSTFLKIGGKDFAWRRLYTFFTKNSASRPLMVIGVSLIVCTLMMMERIIFGPSSYTDYYVLGVIRLLINSFVLLLLFNALSLANSPWITLKSILDIHTQVDTSLEEEEAISEFKKAGVKDGTLPSDLPAMTAAESSHILDQIDKLSSAFKKYMEEEKAYLQPDITIEKVSSQLGTNRFYISRLVNIEQSMTFRDYINTLRISFAKKYMEDNQEANQEQIAFACGFSSASYFNRKFKQMTGVSPQDWKKK